MKKRYINSLCFLFAVAALMYVTVFTPEIIAEAKVKKTIFSYLAEKNVSYSSVSVENKTLAVELLSTGSDRCTLEDVKAILYIHQAIHAKNVIDNIDDLEIVIYNAKGESIYDCVQYDIATRFNDMSNNDISRAFDADVVKNEISDMTGAYPTKSKEILISAANEISGHKVDVVLVERDSGSISMDDLVALYENLRGYASSRGGITQCGLTVQDASGECLLYMGGDFDYGICIGWINQKKENFVTQQTGPLR